MTANFDILAGDKDTDALFRAIGFIVVQWGQAEQSLDLAVTILYRQYGGRHLSSKMPVMLKAKLTFLRSCLSNLPTLAPSKEDGFELASDFDRLSKMRHDLIHGAVVDLSAADEGYQFVKLDLKDNFHHVREVRLEGNAFPKLAKDLVQLGKNSTAFARKIWDQVKGELEGARL